MCGILITATEPRVDSIAHRGTESKSIKVGNITLTHHRLPIQTLDNDEWSMPYEYLPGKYLLFNGEIFNYDSKFSSDTEYLVDFFRRVGEVDIQTLYGHRPEIWNWDGFWSIVLFDSESKNVVAFNDPLGKKQLYVNNIGEICSEINPLVLPCDELDPTYLSTVSKWGYNYNELTPWKGVKRLRPNTWHSYSMDNPSVKTTVPNFEFEPMEITGPEQVYEVLKESVSRRLLSKNYPISVLLSGGLDSTIITSILQDLGADVTYYTISNDEEEYILCCEEYWGIKVNRLTYDLNDEDMLKEIYCKWNESPVDMGSVIPQYHLFDAVAKTGHRIVLSGDGADELFGGYRRIQEYDSQGSDVYDELTYYHLPRLDRMSMAHTIELRNPFLGHDVVRMALGLKLDDRYNKQILKDAFEGKIPLSIISRPKAPLKNNSIKQNALEYRKKAIDLYKTNAEVYLPLKEYRV
jgi:asparagine synthase (glutamine-hydrolysing)